jgi:tol-pal system protein YbgF
MKGNVATVVLATALWLLTPHTSFGQDANGSLEPGSLSLGLQLGGNQVFGDFSNNDIAPGFEGLASYLWLPNLSVNFGLGYGRTKGGPDPALPFAYKVNLLTADLFGQYYVPITPTISPYLRLGVSEYNFNSGSGRFFDTALLGGGGVAFWTANGVGIFIGADYFHTISSPGDGLDGVTAGGHDGMLQGRVGVQFVMHRPEAERPTVIATEPVPVIEQNQREGEELEGFIHKIRSMEQKDRATDMQQYLKLRSRIEELQGRIDEREHEIDGLMKSVQEKKQEIDALEAQVERRSASVSTPSPRAGTRTAGATKFDPEFSKAYEEGLNAYYRKQYPQAIDIFQYLLNTYPNHSLASNCTYWLAESYFGSGQLEQAEKQFWAVLDYPRSLKKDDALFALSKLYLARNDSARARQVLQRLVADYPNSEFAPEAEQQLAKL